MSETRFKKLIVLSAVLGCAVCAAAAAVPELTMLIFKLPCGFFVDLLWELAMTGDGWRIFAIALYVLVCLIPAAALLLLSRRRKPYREDWLLLVMSAALFIFIGRALSSHWDMYSTFAQMGLLAVLVAWLVLRLLRYFNASDDARLVKLARIAVVLLGLIFGFAAGWTLIGAAAGLLGGFQFSLLADGAGAVATDIILVLGCLRALKLINTLGPAGEIADETVTEAEGFYRFSSKALAAIVLISMWASLAKLLLIELSRDNNVNVSLPIFPLLFCLAALIVSRFIAAHKQLRDDNDLFV